MKRFVTSLCIVFFLGVVPSTTLYAQQAGSVSVVTVLGSAGHPLAGASVWYREGARVATTNTRGQVRLDLEAAGDALRIEHSGFDPIVISLDTLSRKTSVTIILKKHPFREGPDDAVQLPFGQLPSGRIVGAVTELKSEDLMTYDANQDVLSAILGRVPGIYGNRDIRGLGNAIVVIDGIPRSSPNNTDRLNMVDDLNLAEISSISVLRDATASMLYGAKAGEGVILINTKHGTPYKRKIHVYAESGVSNPLAYPDYLSASDYMILYNEALANDGLAARYTNDQITKARDHSDPLRDPDEAFFTDRYLRANANFMHLTTEASGGNANTQYYSNLSFDKTGSVLKPQGGGAKSEEYHLNFRGNVDFKINDWLGASLDAAALYHNNTYPNGYYGDSYDGDFFSFAATQLPSSYPVLIPTSEIGDSSILKSAKLVNGQYLLGGTSQYNNNIMGNLVFGGMQTTVQKAMQFNAALRMDLGGILKGLSGDAHFTYDFLNSYTLRQNNKYAVYQPSYVSSSTGDDSLVLTKYGDDVKQNDQTVNGNYFQRRYGFYGTLHYQGKVGDDGQLDATAVAYMTGYNTGNATASTAINSRDQHFGIRANYLLHHAFVAEFDGVYVGSSYLAPGRRYQFSPSGGLGWILTESGLLQSTPVLSYLKLKASYGLLNVDDEYTTYRLYNTNYSRGGNFAYDNASGNGNAVTQLSSVGNPDLGFVREKSFNAGLEASLAENRIWAEANYFNIRTEGEPVIRNAAYPAYLGGFIPTENYNETGHTGAEATVTYNGGKGRFHFRAGLNVTYAVPRDIRESETPHAYAYEYRQGKVSDALFGLVAEGLFKDQADIDGHAVQAFGQVHPGDIKYKDVNGDGVVNEDDEVQIGNNHARFQYGINLDLRFGDFELFALGNAQTGAEVYYNSSYYWVYGDEKYSALVLNRWTPETAATATYPRLTTTNGANNFRNSTYWLYSNDYFTLNRAQLSYHIPARLFWKGLQVYVRGENFLTVGPNRKMRILNVGSAPQMANYAIGLVGSF